MSKEQLKDKAFRIRQERLRLGLTQEQAAKKLGVSRVQWGKYERGVNNFSDVMVMAFEQIGANGLYIQIGENVSSTSNCIHTGGVVNISAKNAFFANELTCEEQRLLHGYRSLDECDKTVINYLMSVLFDRNVGDMDDGR